MKNKEAESEKIDMKELMTNYHKILWYYVTHMHPHDDEILKKLNGSLWAIIVMASIKYENVREYIPSEMISDVNELSGKKIEQYLKKLEDEIQEKIFTMEL